MWAGFDQNIFRSTAIDQSLQDRQPLRMVQASGQLAVRKGSCPALAKLNITDGIKLSGSPKALNVFNPLLYRSATINERDRNSAFSKPLGCKQTRRAHANDQCMMFNLHLGLDSLGFLRQLLQSTTGDPVNQASFVITGEFDRIDFEDAALFTGIDRTPDDFEVTQNLDRKSVV